jgi:O-antigen/teichoic acid export membrane protein
MDGVALPEAGQTPKKRTSIARDAGLTMLTQMGVALATFFQYRVVRSHWSIADFADYSQLFRSRNLMEWIVLLVLPTALVRELSARRATADEGGSRVYVWTGLTLGVLLVGSFSLIVQLVPVQAASVLWGNGNMAKWAGPYCILLAGYAFALVMMSLLRASLLFRPSNLLLLLYTGASPVLCALALRGQPLTAVVSATGISAGIAGMGFLLALLRIRPVTTKPVFAGWETHASAAKELVHYGAPRLITLACISVLTLGLPWLMQHAGDHRLVASLNAVLLAVGATTILIAPVGFVLLPHLSSLVAKGDHREAGRQLTMVVEFTLLTGGAVALLSLGLLEPFLHGWLGKEVSSFPSLIIGACLAIPCYLVLEILRSPIDAASKVPWNAVTYGTGSLAVVCTVLILEAMGLPFETVAAIALPCGYFLAAAVALFLSSRLYPLRLSRANLGVPLCVWAVVLAVLAWERGHATPLALALSAVLCCAVYATSAVAMKPAWFFVLLPRRFHRFLRGTA